MHGAGLTHAIFLPKHAGVIELFPKYRSVSNAHFKAISRWRGLHYIVWQNLLRENEIAGEFTKIPERILIKLVSKMKDRICRER
ncbi:hypothetical protein KUTeg_018239 [Tegillarca granosa]|uniref:Uncharacterized protein n=1 Tax=Tegillarca granosa TaxID=220873 RepID=A0ABQ9EHB9_TEGGR|nr:hypothetical protein KUTeg_018239 [Tegillarca granosa]